MSLLMRKAAAGVAAIAIATTAFATNPASAQAEELGSQKKWVCKFVGTPGENERLKSGKNPISNATKADIGQEFTDAQGRSLVIAYDNGGPQPSRLDCIKALNDHNNGTGGGEW